MDECGVLSGQIYNNKYTKKIHKTVATRAALFGANMHQIVFRMGLCPRHIWGAYSVPPTPSCFGVGVRLQIKGERKEG